MAGGEGRSGQGSFVGLMSLVIQAVGEGCTMGSTGGKTKGRIISGSIV